MDEKEIELIDEISIDEKTTEGKIKDVNISKEMKKSFLSYAMSVIVSRALPDIKDGLKPVQRRIIYGMNELGIYATSAYKKSARIVGDVMGKYHPHGDSSIYDTMVRMAQDFSYRYLLVDGHGNFGSIDGDSAAAMRYTEARMSKIAMEMVRDIDKDTVDYIGNYDNSEKEPKVLPSRFPNLLVNGSTGIAVGMATNIPPHNLGEIIDGIIAYKNNKDITILELMKYIKGPDFPTGAQILGTAGLKSAYETGRGAIIIRSKADIIESKTGKTSIVITQIPYQVNKTTLIERIAELAKLKKIEGINELRDESNRKGIRIVIDLKKNINAKVLLNNLYKNTNLQKSFTYNMIALVDNKPEIVNLKKIISEYFKFQVDIIQRRTKYDLAKAEARAHLLRAFVTVLNDLERALEIIKTSRTGEIAKNRLMEEYSFDEIQAKAILDMRLQRLTGLEIEKIKQEAEEIRLKIIELKAILASDELKEEIIEEELLEIKNKYSDPRRSEIDFYSELSIENEDLIPVEDIVVTLTQKGYIKRMKIDQYKQQRRGGKGLSGINVHEDDFVEHIKMTSTHDYHLFFTNTGKVYRLKGYAIVETSRIGRGIPIVNLLKLDENEKITSFTNLKKEDDKGYLFFITKKGIVKKVAVEHFKNLNANGKRAITLNEEDELIDVKLTDGNKDIFLGASNGLVIRFSENLVRSMGRTAFGVQTIKLKDDEHVIGAVLIENETDEILVITENGYGKRTLAEKFRPRLGRRSRGVNNLKIVEKNGKPISIKIVNNEDDLIVITDKGVVIRVPIETIRETGRVAIGVKIIDLKEGHKVVTTAVVPKEQQEEIDEEKES